MSETLITAPIFLRRVLNRDARNRYTKIEAGRWCGGGPFPYGRS